MLSFFNQNKLCFFFKEKNVFFWPFQMLDNIYYTVCDQLHGSDVLRTV